MGYGKNARVLPREQRTLPQPVTDNGFAICAPSVVKARSLGPGPISIPGHLSRTTRSHHSAAAVPQPSRASRAAFRRLHATCC